MYSNVEKSNTNLKISNTNFETDSINFEAGNVKATSDKVVIAKGNTPTAEGVEISLFVVGCLVVAAWFATAAALIWRYCKKHRNDDRRQTFRTDVDIENAPQHSPESDSLVKNTFDDTDAEQMQQNKDTKDRGDL